MPKEEVAMETIGALVDLYGDRHLAVGRCRPPKKRTQGDGGSRQKWAATRSSVIQPAVPVRRKGRDHKGPTLQMRRRKGNNVRGARWQLGLRKERASGRIFRKTVELEI